MIQSCRIYKISSCTINIFNPMKGSYRRRLIVNFLLIFLVFTAVILFFTSQHDVRQRRRMLGERLNASAVLADRFLADYPQEYGKLGDLFSSSMRLTVIDLRGNVLFDNMHEAPMENHMERPELQTAMRETEGKGDAIRYSTTFGKKYYYYALRCQERYVRLALPYESTARHELAPDWLFIVFIASLFAVALIALLFLSDHMGRTIASLRKFTARAKEGKLPQGIKLPNSELGHIASDIIDAYSNLHKANDRLQLEQEKMHQHFMLAQEGVAIFNEEKEVLYANSLYVKYVNLIRDKAVLSAEGTCDYPEFAALMDFRTGQLQQSSGEQKRDSGASKKVVIPVGSTWIEAKMLTFPDSSFEIVLSDVSQIVEERKLKREMSSNIAHELRTPVASILGYVETMMRNPDLDAERRMHFLDKAHQQVMRLNELITEVTDITLSEEAPDKRTFRKFDLAVLFDNVVAEFQPKLTELRVEVKNDLDKPLMISAIDSLIAAVLRNLIANSTRYAGEGFSIVFRKLSEDKHSYLLSYYDTGKGVPQEALPRIFERFYRVDDGRARQNGGSGLGLAIVKNAIAAHGSQVYARIPQGGGLEILFSLSKA